MIKMILVNKKVLRHIYSTSNHVQTYVSTHVCMMYVITDARTYLKSSEYVTLSILNCFALFCCDAEGELVCVCSDQMLQFKKHTLHLWKHCVCVCECVCVCVCKRVVGYVSV